MTGRHTPGPWREGNRFATIIADGDTGHDDTASVKAYGGHLVCESVVRSSNARLIAAAPEMLDALKVAGDYLDACRHNGLPDLGDASRMPFISEVINQIDMAIDKAQGRT